MSYRRPTQPGYAFYEKQKGASAIEYAIIAGLISVAFIGVLSGTGGEEGLGTKISNVFQAVSDALPTLDQEE